MKLGVVLRLYLGELKQEESEKVIADLIARLKTEDANMSGQRWSIDLGEDRHAFGLFLAFSKSVFLTEILKTDFPQVNPYYMQLIKQADETALFERCKNKSKSKPTAFGQQSVF